MWECIGDTGRLSNGIAVIDHVWCSDRALLRWGPLGAAVQLVVTPGHVHRIPRLPATKAKNPFVLVTRYRRAQCHRDRFERTRPGQSSGSMKPRGWSPALDPRSATRLLLLRVGRRMRFGLRRTELVGRYRFSRGQGAGGCRWQRLRWPITWVPALCRSRRAGEPA